MCNMLKLIVNFCLVVLSFILNNRLRLLQITFIEQIFWKSIGLSSIFYLYQSLLDMSLRLGIEVDISPIVVNLAVVCVTCSGLR